MVFAEFYYWTRKLQARFFAGDFASAVDAALHADSGCSGHQRRCSKPQNIGSMAALAHAAAWDSRRPEAATEAFRVCAGASQAAAKSGPSINPETFENRAALVGAEIARIEGRMLDAQELYEKAIRSAHTHGFVHNEALANELAGLLLRGARFREDCDDLPAGSALLLPALGS